MASKYSGPNRVAVSLDAGDEENGVHCKFRGFDTQPCRFDARPLCLVAEFASRSP